MTDFFESFALMGKSSTYDLFCIQKSDSFEKAKKILARFISLFDTVVNFVENEGEEDLAQEIRNHKIAIHFLASIFRKFNEVSFQLQGKLCTLLDCKHVLNGFTKKLRLFQINIKNFNGMPELTEVIGHLSDETNKKYAEYLLKLKEELSIRFSDLLEFEVQPWMMDPFGSDMETVSDNIQEELIELKCNDEYKYKFERGE